MTTLVDRLRAAGCVAAEEEAALLAAAAPDPVDLEQRVRRREAGEPLAWIVGAVAFAGHRVEVDPGVYVPRRQSEELAERAAAALPAAGRAADLCTGAGAVAVHLAAVRPGALVVGVDVDPIAVRCARRHGITAIVGDLDAPLRSGAWDVVTAVAPYVPTDALAFLPAEARDSEPMRALDGGDDGLAVVRRVVAGAARLLRPGGVVFLEIGGDQDGPVTRSLRSAGFGDVETWTDGDGDLRGITATRAG